MRHQGRRPRLVAGAVVAFAAALSLFPASVQAVSPELLQNLDGITHGLRNTHRPLASPEVCDAVCTRLVQNYRSLGSASNAAVATAVEAEALGAAKGAGLLPKAPVGGSAIQLCAGANLIACGGALYAGWQIGTGANKLFFHFNMPAAPSCVADCPQQVTGVQAAGTSGPGIPSGYVTEPYVQLQHYVSGNWVSLINPPGSAHPGCAPHGPWPLSAPYRTRAVGDCAGVTQTAAYMHFSDFVPRGPATAIPAPDEGVDGARWISQPPPDPGFAATRNWLESHLDDDEHDQLVPWLNHQADPAKYPDPTTTEEEDHRCDLSDPTYNNAGGNTTPSPLTPKVPAPFEAADRPDGAIGTLDPYLRWGETNWLGTFIDNWSQWGWRHIQAKHGWGNDDLLATTNTLSQPVRTVPQGTGVDGNPNGEPTAMLYAGPEYEQNGARCERRVVVEYGIQAPETEPKGIITSYGHSLGNAN